MLFAYYDLYLVIRSLAFTVASYPLFLLSFLAGLLNHFLIQQDSRRELGLPSYHTSATASMAERLLMPSPPERASASSDSPKSPPRTHFTPPNSACRSPHSPGHELGETHEEFGTLPFPLLEAVDAQLRYHETEPDSCTDDDAEHDFLPAPSPFTLDQNTCENLELVPIIDRGRTPVQTFTHRRPSSVPARKLKSALITPPCTSPESEQSHPGGKKKKSARFEDDAASRSRDFSTLR